MSHDQDIVGVDGLVKSKIAFECMEGEYYLVVYLKMNEGKFPGMPELADYVWFDFDLITLTGDGTQHYEFDVTVLPILLSPFCVQIAQ